MILQVKEAEGIENDHENSKEKEEVVKVEKKTENVDEVKRKKKKKKFCDFSMTEWILLIFFVVIGLCAIEPVVMELVVNGQ